MDGLKRVLAWARWCLRRSWAVSRRRFLALACLVVYLFMGDMVRSFRESFDEI